MNLLFCHFFFTVNISLFTDMLNLKFTVCRDWDSWNQKWDSWNKKWEKTNLDYPQYHKFSGDDKNLFQLSHSLFLLSHSLHTVYIRLKLFYKDPFFHFFFTVNISLFTDMLNLKHTVCRDWDNWNQKWDGWNKKCNHKFWLSPIWQIQWRL